MTEADGRVQQLARPWKWNDYTGLARFDRGCRNRLQRCIGAAQASRAITMQLVGYDGGHDDNRRRFLLPLYGIDGAVVSAVRVDPTGAREPMRLRNTRVGLPAGTPVWLSNYGGGPTEVLDRTTGKDLHITLAPLGVLTAPGEEATLGLTSRASFNELIVLIGALAEYRRPERCVVHFGETIYPEQVLRLRELGCDIYRLKTEEDRERDRREAATDAPIFVLASGRIAYWSQGAHHGRWREAAKGVAMNILTERGFSAQEARRMIPVLHTAVDYTFEPRSTDPVHRDGDESFLNTYTGIHVKPDHKPWTVLHQILNHLCHADAGGIEYVLDWLAAPLQSLRAGQGSERNMSALVFHGAAGTGKGLVAEALRVIYTDYLIEIGQAQLEDSFDHKRFASSLMIIANEVSAGSRGGKAMIGRLKSWVTEKHVSIRRMRMEADEYPIHFNMMFFSNLHDPLPLDETDRRFSVWYQPQPLPKDIVRAARKEKLAGWPSVRGLYRHLLDREVTRDLYVPWPNNDRQQLIALARGSASIFAEVIFTEGLNSVGKAWLREEATRNRRAGRVDEEIRLVDNGFTLLTTLSEVYAMWCKSHNHRDVDTATRLRREIEARVPWATYGRARVSGKFGWGFHGLPMAPADRMVDVGSGAPPPAVDLLGRALDEVG